MNSLQAYAFNTRYEIHGYELGMFPQLEKEFSLWDDIYHTSLPKYHYDEDNHILYIPRGYDSFKLENLIGKPITIKRCPTERKRASYTVSAPRDDIQKESVRFLAGLEEYERMKGESQLVLSLPTGVGKTYCAIAACSLLGVKTMIIVGTDDLRKQWKEKIIEYTGLPLTSICSISGQQTINRLLNAKEKKINNYAFYITTHSSLRAYMKACGFHSLEPLFEKLGIGVKIIDEAHTQYLNTLMIDYATNVWKTFYLTATFEQSEQVEDWLFQRAFNKVFKLVKYSKARKHVKFIGATFSSRANAVEKLSVMGKKGIDKYKYIEYEIGKGKILEVYTHFLDLFINKMKLEGKMLVLSPKKESCDLLQALTKELLPAYSTCVHYSGNKVDDFTPYGIIFATPKMLGTGNDISGLRVMINLEPIRSKRNIIQIVGRLREFAPDKDTFFVGIFDKSIPSVASMYRDWKELMKSICKEFLPVEFK